MTDHDTFPTTLLPMDQMPPVRTQHDLERTWSLLLSPLGFATPQVWILVLKDDRIVQAANLPELPLEPGQMGLELIKVLVDIARRADGGGREVALLYARPGGTMRTVGDLEWARALASLSPSRPVHLANDVEITVVAPDDPAPRGDRGVEAASYGSRKLS